MKQPFFLHENKMKLYLSLYILFCLTYLGEEGTD